MSRILGIDPGLSTTGFGLVEKKGNKLLLLDYGTVKTKASESVPYRLQQIYDVLAEVIEKWKPEASAIEDVFQNKNFKSAVKIAYVRATAMVACNLQKVGVFEYTPREMKKSVVGYGNAEKTQVQSMVQMLLGLKKPVTPLDASDALGMAICHINTIPLRRTMEMRR